MTHFYNLSDRKPLVKALEEITEKKAVYKGTPTCAYEVDYFTITHEGNLVCNDNADPDMVETVIAGLESRGFHAEGYEYDSPMPDIEEENTADSEDLSLTVKMPRDYFTEDGLDNLRKIVEAKAPLLKEALGVSELPVEVTDTEVSFPWFTEDIDAEHCGAYTSLITALCRMAKEAKRVTAKEKDAVNPKYEFRCFLLRLGFIGDEFKANRKILLERLSGSSAFKTEKKEAAVCSE